MEQLSTLLKGEEGPVEEESAWTARGNQNGWEFFSKRLERPDQGFRKSWIRISPIQFSSFR